MTQTEILNECKQQITDEYGYVRWEGVVENKVEAAISELAILFAQRMSEKFAEWIMDARVGINREKGFVYPRESWDYYDHKELYQIFLTTLNKD